MSRQYAARARKSDKSRAAPRRGRVTPAPAGARACCAPQLQTRRQSALTVQTKLTLGPAGDRYEQEADSVARQVMRQINSPEAHIAEPAETSVAPVAQRQDDFDEDELMMKSVSGAEGGPINADIESSIQSARSGGRSLGGAVQASMESAFSADFSGVKVHTDNRSNDLNQSLQARAFTTGQDIFFRQGEYRPESSGGQELLAHELTHVVQQNGDRVLS